MFLCVTSGILFNELITDRENSFIRFGIISCVFREQILWFLLIQYGAHVSVIDAYSRQFYLKMSRK